MGSHFNHSELHIMNDVGHIDSTDCWCEPTYYLVDGDDSPNDVPTLVVEHEDDGRERTTVLALRTSKPDWLDSLLNSLR